MIMGVFDVAAPLLTWMDASAAQAMPSWLRLVVWAMMAATASMLVYRRLSPQERIRRGKIEMRQAQQRLNAFDGEFNDAWPLMRDMLRSALRQVARVGWPAIVASLPLIFLLNWMSTSYGYAFPEAGAPLQIRTVPERFTAAWMAPDPSANRFDPHIVVSDHENQTVIDVPLAVPIPVIHKQRWWNVLIGNPAGYLPAGAPVDRIQAQLPRQQHLAFGPGWLRGWEFLFFTSLLLVSVALKIKLKIA
jgi:hypothetical protein